MANFSYTLIQRNKSRGLQTWYARIYNKKERSIKYVSLQTTKKGVATAILADKIATGELEADIDNRITFKTAINKFLKKCAQNAIKERSIKAYETALNCFKPLFKEEVCQTPAEKVFDVFNDAFGDKSTATFNLRKTICSSMYRFLIDELDLPIKNPFRKLRAKRNIPVHQKSFWTIEQIEKILDNAITHKHRIFYALMAYAGLRSFEAMKLKREDIRDGKIYLIGKGNKVAFVPICEMLEIELNGYNGDYDFSSVGCLNTFKRTVKKAGLYDDANIGFHRLRHSFGSNLIRAGANIKAVQLLMRHSNIQTTLNIYAHLLEEDLLASVNLLGNK